LNADNEESKYPEPVQSNAPAYIPPRPIEPPKPAAASAPARS